MADRMETAVIDAEATDARRTNGSATGGGARSANGSAGRFDTPEERGPLGGARLPAAIGGIGAVGGVLAVVAGQLAGDGPVAAVCGLVVGAVAALAGWAALRPLLATERTAPGRARADVPLAALPVAPAPAGPDARAAANLEPLVTALGRRFLALSDRQLGALGGPGVGLTPAAADLESARRLTLRTRRAASTLVVLANADRATTETTHALPPGDRTVAEIIELALADSDHRDQVDTSSVHPATVDAVAVGDLVHLLAELIDNAVLASADPRTTVVVVGRRARDGYVLSVVDEGVGMPPTQRDSANGQLTAPPTLGEQQAEALGLSVVGRLAARHGIGVVLLESATDGVIAKVRVPARLLDGGTTDVISPYERTVEALAAPTTGADAAETGAPGTPVADTRAAEGDLVDVVDLREPAEVDADDAVATTGDEEDGQQVDEAGAPGSKRRNGGASVTRPMSSARPTRR